MQANSGIGERLVVGAQGGFGGPHAEAGLFELEQDRLAQSIALGEEAEEVGVLLGDLRAGEEAGKDRPGQIHPGAPVPGEVGDIAAAVGEVHRGAERRAVAAPQRREGELLRAHLLLEGGHFGAGSQRLIGQRLGGEIFAAHRRWRTRRHIEIRTPLDPDREVQLSARDGVGVLGGDERRLGGGAIGAGLREIDLGALADPHHPLDLDEVALQVCEGLGGDGDEVALRPRGEISGSYAEHDLEARRALGGELRGGALPCGIKPIGGLAEVPDELVEREAGGEKVEAIERAAGGADHRSARQKAWTRGEVAGRAAVAGGADKLRQERGARFVGPGARGGGGEVRLTKRRLVLEGEGDRVVEGELARRGRGARREREQGQNGRPFRSGTHGFSLTPREQRGAKISPRPGGEAPNQRAPPSPSGPSFLRFRP